MIAKAQPHLGEALPCLPLTKGEQRCFQLMSAGALEKMSSPYRNPPCGSLPVPQSHAAAPCSSALPPQRLINHHLAREGTPRRAHIGAGSPPPGPQDPISSPRKPCCHCCSWTGRAAAAAPLVLPPKPTPALPLPSQGSGEDTLSPTERDPALQHQSSGWSQRPWWSFHWFGQLWLSPSRTRFPMTHSAGRGEIIGKVASVALSMKERAQTGAWKDLGAGKS